MAFDSYVNNIIGKATAQTAATQIANQNEAAPSKSEVSSLQATINNIVNTNWMLTDDFEFTFYNFAIDINKFIVHENTIVQNIFDRHTMSCEIPILTTGEYETVSGGERRINNKMIEMFRFNAKFRDSDSAALRRYFMKIIAAQQFEYFDDIKSTITIMNNGVLVYYSTNILITSISPIQFSHDSTQIAEFDVAFISNTYGDVDVNDFGKTSYVDNFARKGTNTYIEDSRSDFEISNDL